MPPPCLACSHPTDAHYGICKFCQDKYIEAIAKGHVEKRARVVIELNPRASCRQERSARTRAPTLEAADLDPCSSSTRPASTRDLEAGDTSQAGMRRAWEQVWQELEENRVPNAALVGVVFLIRGVHAIIEYLGALR